MGELYDLIVNKFMAAAGEYLGTLDWAYMITLTVIVGCLNLMFPVGEFRLGRSVIKLNKRYRVVLIAFILALIFYGLSDSYGKAIIKTYFQSMFAAMVLHMIIMDRLMRLLEEHVPAMSDLKEKMNLQKPKE